MTLIGELHLAYLYISLFTSFSSYILLFRWRTMLYVASMPGFLLALGMQFAVESPRWLCKV